MGDSQLFELSVAADVDFIGKTQNCVDAKHSETPHTEGLKSKGHELDIHRREKMVLDLKFENNNLHSYLSKNPKIFFIDYHVKEGKNTEKDIKNLFSKIDRPLMLQHRGERKVTIYIKQNKNTDLCVVKLYEEIEIAITENNKVEVIPEKCNNDIEENEYERKKRERVDLLKEKQKFGLPLIIDSLLLKYVGNFCEYSNKISLLNVHFDLNCNLMGLAIDHDNVLVTKYLSMFKCHVNFDPKDDELLKSAVQKCCTETLAALLGLSYPLIAETEDVPKNIYVAIDGNSLVHLFATHYKVEMLSFFVKNGIPVHSLNSSSKRIVDICWGKMLYSSVLELLKADSMFPKGFSLENLEKIANKLKGIADSNGELTKTICEKRLNELLENCSSKNELKIRWEIELYFSVLELLKADSRLTEGFSVSALIEDVNKLKHFADNNEELHKLICEGEVNKLPNFMDEYQSRYYLNTRNKSAIATALEKKQFKCFAYLQSRGVTFWDFSEKTQSSSNITPEEENAINDAREEYFFDSEDSHILMLQSMSKSHGGMREDVGTYYKTMSNHEFLLSMLKVIQYAYGLKIIFDFNSSDLGHMSLRDNSVIPGKNAIDQGRIYIAAKTETYGKFLRTVDDIRGTLSHELAHQVMYMLYDNEAKPYYDSDGVRKKEFEDIACDIFQKVMKCVAIDFINDLKKKKKDEVNSVYVLQVKKHLKRKLQIKSAEVCLGEIYRTRYDEELRKIDESFIKKVINGQTSYKIDQIIQNVFLLHHPNVWYAELIVRIPQLIAKNMSEDILKGEEMVKTQVPNLLTYFNNNIKSYCDHYAKKLFFKKPVTTIELLSKYVGENTKIENHKVKLLGKPKSYKKFINKHNEMEFLMSASPLLCSIHVKQQLSNGSPHCSKSRLFIESKKYYEYKSTIISAVKSNACKDLVLIFCDEFETANVLFDKLESLKNDFEKMKKKPILIFKRYQKYKEEELKDISYNWDELEESSKDYLLEEEVVFQGNSMPFKDLVNKEMAKEIINGDVLSELVG